MVEWQASKDANYQSLKLFISLPPRQNDLIKPPHKLCAASNRFTSIGNAETDQRCLLLIAQMAKELKDYTLCAWTACEEDMNFVNDDNANFELLQKSERPTNQRNRRSNSSRSISWRSERIE